MSRRQAAAAAVAIAAGILAGCTTGESTPSTSSAAWDAAPQEYRDGIIIALTEQGCDSIDKDLIAAQLRVESGFTADKVGPAGQIGPAMLLPAVVEQYREQTGVVDVRRPLDAARVLAAVNCANAQVLAERGVTVTPTVLAQAWVAGVTSIVETTRYSDRIAAESGRQVQ